MDYQPEEHEYTTNPTYTGFGCAQFGKEENGHKLPAPNKLSDEERMKIAAEMSKL